MYQDVCLLDNDCYAFAAFHVHAHALLPYKACLTYNITFAAGLCFLESSSSHEGFLPGARVWGGPRLTHLCCYEGCASPASLVGQLTQSWLDIQG